LKLSAISHRNIASHYTIVNFLPPGLFHLYPIVFNEIGSRKDLKSGTIICEDIYYICPTE
jgi:hypothetical protein